MRTPIAILPLLLLAACGQNPSDPAPGGVTAGEAKALDDAAAMLDQRRPETVTVPQSATRPAPAAKPTPAPTPIQEAPQ